MRRGERAENESGIELQEYSDRLGSSEMGSFISDFRFDLGSLLPVDGVREQLATDRLELSSLINSLNSFIVPQINNDQGDLPGYSPLLDRIRPLDYPKVRVEFDRVNRHSYNPNLFVPIPHKIFKAPKEENLRGLPADVWMIIAGFVLESSVEDAYSFASTCLVFYNLVAAEPN